MENTAPQIPNIKSFDRRKKYILITISLIVLIVVLLVGYMHYEPATPLLRLYGRLAIKELTANDIMQAKAYLYVKYRPGNCFGMPTIMTNFAEKEFNTAVAKYPEEAELLRTVYSLHTDQQLANAILGMQRIDYEDHIFTFVDGNCCNTVSYIVSIKKLIINLSIVCYIEKNMVEFHVKFKNGLILFITKCLNQKKFHLAQH